MYFVAFKEGSRLTGPFSKHSCIAQFVGGPIAAAVVDTLASWPSGASDTPSRQPLVHCRVAKWAVVVGLKNPCTKGVKYNYGAKL